MSLADFDARGEYESSCELAECDHPDCHYAHAVDTLEFTADLPAPQFYAPDVQGACWGAGKVIDRWERGMLASVRHADHCAGLRGPSWRCTC